MNQFLIYLLFLVLVVFILFVSLYHASFQLSGEQFKPYKNLPKILILVISSSKHPRWTLEKEIWERQLEKNHPNIDIFFIECMETFTLKENCRESYIPGIYQKTLLSLSHLKDYDFYIRSNLSTFFIFEYLYEKLSTLPIHKAVYTGYPWSWGVSGTGIIFTHEAKKRLLERGFEDQFYHQSKIPDDVLISKVFKEQNVEKVHTPKILFTWNYNNSWYNNMKEIRDGKYPLCRMRHDKDVSLQIKQMKLLLDSFQVIYIKNAASFHYEIIETIILKHSFLLKKTIPFPMIYLDVYKNRSFEKYIEKKYPFIQFGKPRMNVYDYCIDCSYYENYTDYVNDGKHYYLSHNYLPEQVSRQNIFS